MIEIKEFTWTDTWWTLIGFTALFVALHVVAVLKVEPVYSRAFKLSRAGAALILTLLGFAAFIDGFGHWREAFLYRHPDNDWMRIGLLLVYGHLIADFIWMAIGKYKYNITPRIDLIIHHGLGVIGFGAALMLGIGYAFGLLTMITELMPLSTGLGAWGKFIDSAKVIEASAKARLYVLAWLRLPLWISLLALVVSMLVKGSDAVMFIAYMVSGTALLGLIWLDIFWMSKCLKPIDA